MSFLRIGSRKIVYKGVGENGFHRKKYFPFSGHQTPENGKIIFQKMVFRPTKHTLRVYIRELGSKYMPPCTTTTNTHAGNCHTLIAAPGSQANPIHKGPSIMMADVEMVQETPIETLAALGNRRSMSRSEDEESSKEPRSNNNKPREVINQMFQFGCLENSNKRPLSGNPIPNDHQLMLEEGGLGYAEHEKPLEAQNPVCSQGTNSPALNDQQKHAENQSALSQESPENNIAEDIDSDLQLKKQSQKVY